MGVAEAGVPFYDFQNQYNINKDAWAHYALGYPANISVAAIPANWFMAFLQHSGVNSVLLQAFFLWMTLVVSGMGIYSITRILFPDLPDRFFILSVLFYWFNPFSMVNVWNRFLNNFFVFYMLLPISTYFFIKGIRTKKYYFSILIGLVSVFLSYALTSVAFNILLWLVLTYVAMFHFLISQEKGDRIFVIKFFIITLLFWCLANLWWISQALSYVYSGSFSEVEKTSFSLKENQQIFTDLSKKLGNLIDILRFQHSSVFNKDSGISWINWYLFPPIAYLSFGFSLVIFLPLVLIKKSSAVLFLSGLLILGIFLSKGNNPPFGDVLNILFRNIGLFQAFRNAFEKFGFILPLAGAPLFSYGIYLIAQRFRKKGRLIFLVSLVWLAVVWGFPYWSGLIFTSNELPASSPEIGYQVKVPDYYKKASEWLSNQPNNFRLLVFPIGGEGITNTWEKGYTGVELSNQLLPVTSVSFQTNVPFYENISSDLEKTLMSNSDFTKAANMLNAKYILVRKDIDWHARSMRDPMNITNNLANRNSQFKIVAEFGELIFWENLYWDNNKIYGASNIISVSPKANISDSQFLDKNAVIVEKGLKFDGLSTSEYVLHPWVRFSLMASTNLYSRTGQDIFPYIKYSPDSKVYKFILFKERLDLNTTLSAKERINLGIKLLGKRLVEAKLEADSNNGGTIIIALNEYDKILNTLGSSFSEYFLINSDFNKQIYKQEELYSIFSEHKKILTELINRFAKDSTVVDKIGNTVKLLNSLLVDYRIQPLFAFKDTDGFPIKSRIAYKFSVNEPGEYELLWGSDSFDKYYKKDDGKQILFQLDDKLIPSEISYTRYGNRSLGKISLNQGIHEVAINTGDEINLVDTPSEINLEVKHGAESRTFPIQNYDPFASYTISFDYWIKMGYGVEVSVEANNSKVKLGSIVPDFLNMLFPDNYDFREKHFSGMVKINGSADKAKLILTVKPWNNCETIFFTNNKERCRDTSFRYPYDRTTEVVVKNISVTRDLVDEPFLVRTGQVPSGILPNISYKENDNTNYSISVSNAKQPYILIFSELFDVGWKLFDLSGTEVEGKHFLINEYANGWELNKTGNYELILKYVPQDLLDTTKKISVAVILFGFFILCWRLRRR